LLAAFVKFTDYRKGARGKPAYIQVNASLASGKINPPWRNFAQGGEERTNMILPMQSQIKNLKAEYVRIDHIYDYYDIVQSDGSYNFSQLDEVVISIVNSGAKPFLSLSYIPEEFNGKNITSPPDNWQKWQNLIQTTIERYSSFGGMAINNVYYEVFNEPDLFGSWHYNKEPNYLTLYRYSSKAAANVKNAQNFMIGGPATTSFYPNWIKALLNYCQTNNLRIDFISWHDYSLSPQQTLQKTQEFRQILLDYPNYAQLETIISEYGPASGKSALYQSRIGAAYQLATAVNLFGYVDKMFAFELKDGPEDNTGWGLLTHESKGLKSKPRYQAFQFLNLINGERVSLSGEGSWVQGLAFINENGLNIFLTNFDVNNTRYENVPIRVDGLTTGNYKVRRDYLFGNDFSTWENVSSDVAILSAPIEANDAVLITFYLQSETSQPANITNSN
jgi:hypothetical protein